MKSKYIFLLFIALKLFSQGGNSGLKFLLTYDTKSSSLGESCIMNTTGSSATLSNPSNIIINKGTEVQVGIIKLFTDVNSQYLLFKSGFSSNISYGFHILNYRISDIEIRDIPGESIGNFNVQYLSTGLSLAYLLDKNFSIGTTIRFLYEKIFIEESSGLSIDFGSYYTLNDKVRIGMIINNLGYMNNLKYEKSKLPLVGGIGVQYNQEFSVLNNYITIELRRHFEDKKNHFSLGFETQYNNKIFARFGYITGYEAKDFTFGLGIKYWNINLNYSYIPYSFDLGDSHSISIRFLL